MGGVFVACVRAHLFRVRGPSPDGSYYAQIIDSDQGAMGGNTFVEVCASEELDALLFKIKKKPRQIYSGAWGEAHSLQIRWKDDCTLEINSGLYEIE